MNAGMELESKNDRETRDADRTGSSNSANRHLCLFWSELNAEPPVTEAAE